MLSLFTLAAMLATQGPTGTITGRVLAAGSELPIAEAIVAVEGIEARATTTASGMFRLEGIPPGIYTVRALAGFIHMGGLLPPDQLNIADYALTAYKRASEENDPPGSRRIVRTTARRRRRYRRA